MNFAKIWKNFLRPEIREMIEFCENLEVSNIEEHEERERAINYFVKAYKYAK